MTKLSHTLSYRLLRRWDHFCRLLPPVVSSRRWEVWSDASGKGYGGHLGPQSAPIDVWTDSHPFMLSSKGRLSTEYVEALAVLLSLRRWSDILKGKKVFFYVDNYRVYQVLSRRYTPKLNLDFDLDLRNSMRLGLGLGLGSVSVAVPRAEPSSSTKVRSIAEPTDITSKDQSGDRGNDKLKLKGEDKGYFSANPRCPKTQATFDEIDSIIRANGIQLVARWVWGKDNGLADALSRLNTKSGDLARCIAKRGTGISGGTGRIGFGTGTGIGPGNGTGTGNERGNGIEKINVFGNGKLSPHVIGLLEAGMRAGQTMNWGIGVEDVADVATGMGLSGKKASS